MNSLLCNTVSLAALGEFLNHVRKARPEAMVSQDLMESCVIEQGSWLYRREAYFGTGISEQDVVFLNNVPVWTMNKHGTISGGLAPEAHTWCEAIPVMRRLLAELDLLPSVGEVPLLGPIRHDFGDDWHYRRLRHHFGGYPDGDLVNATQQDRICYRGEHRASTYLVREIHSRLVVRKWES